MNAIIVGEVAKLEGTPEEIFQYVQLNEKGVSLEQHYKPNFVVQNTVPGSNSSIPTLELVNELSNRKGVNVYNIDPHVTLAMDMGKDGFTETGPFKILIVKK